MKPRYSFSSRHNRQTENMRKQRKKYPSIAERIIEDSDIILEILDARFIDETRNEDYEDKIKNKKRRLIYVFNKADLISDKSRNKVNLFPGVFVSCTKRRGVSELRNLIKRESKKVENVIDKDKSGKVTVGVIGYPNTGKSSLINLLIGKSSAGASPQSGYTKSLQKLKLSENIQLLDSPGVIPEKEYSTTDRKKIAMHAKVGARDYSKVNDPEMAVAELMNEYGEAIDNHYKINSKNDVEILIEELGKRRGFFKKGGVVDEDKTSRFILKEWQAGEIKI